MTAKMEEKEAVSDKVIDEKADAEPKVTAENEKEKEGSFRDYIRVFSYADRLDWTLNIIAAVCSIAAGATLPLMTLIFGGFTTKFNNFAVGISTPSQFRSDVDHYTLWFIYLFIGRFGVAYIANICITTSAIRTTRALRKKFLECTLRQEVWYFDRPAIGSPATQVTTNGNRINQGQPKVINKVLETTDIHRHRREASLYDPSGISLLLFVHHRSQCSMEASFNHDEYCSRTFHHYRHLHRG